MKPKKCKTKAEAQAHAIEWQLWQSEQNLSWSEMNKWAYHFEKLGKKFKLTKEFKENGII